MLTDLKYAIRQLRMAREYLKGGVPNGRAKAIDSLTRALDALERVVGEAEDVETERADADRKSSI